MKIGLIDALNNIPYLEIRNAALNNLKVENEERRRTKPRTNEILVRDYCSAIDSAFTWERTPQGSMFWSNLSHGLREDFILKQRYFHRKGINTSSYKSPETGEEWEFR